MCNQLSFENWENGGFADAASKPCTRMVLESGNRGSWLNEVCSEKRYFVCTQSASKIISDNQGLSRIKLNCLGLCSIKGVNDNFSAQIFYIYKRKSTEFRTLNLLIEVMLSSNEIFSHDSVFKNFVFNFVQDM